MEMELIEESGQEQKSQRLCEYQFSDLMRTWVALFLCPAFGNVLRGTVLYHRYHSDFHWCPSGAEAPSQGSATRELSIPVHLQNRKNLQLLELEISPNLYDVFSPQALCTSLATLRAFQEMQL